MNGHNVTKKSTMPQQTKTTIERAQAAASALDALLDERQQRYIWNKDDKSRPFFEVDKSRLDQAITSAAVVLGKAASRLRDQLHQPVNKQFFAIAPLQYEREQEKLEDYRIMLRVMCEEGLLSEGLLQREDKNISILDKSFDDMLQGSI
ncbi:hypothetical protein KCU92_g10161, partial [Aureobasidium melanogenum]|jgi:hypothetical protein